MTIDQIEDERTRTTGNLTTSTTASHRPPLKPEDTAYVTMVTTDNYVVGALVLGHSLRAVDIAPGRMLICMVTDNLSTSSLDSLRTVFDKVVQVPKLDSHDHTRLALLGRPELGQTMTKLNAWSLPALKKAVFIDADVLVLKSLEDLFERPELAACADVGWPDCFNSGLFVLEPNENTFHRLLEHAKHHGSFDGGDQGLLNSFFSGWSTSGPEHRIPFIYNVTFTSSYGYAPALAHFREHIRAVHFIGADKPWLYHRDANGRIIGRMGVPNTMLEYVHLWWSIHDQHVKQLIEQHDRPTFSGLYNNGIKSSPSTTNHSEGGQSNSKVDCDFATYRIQWNREFEEYFAAKQQAATQIIRKTTPVADEECDEDELDLVKPFTLRSLLRKTRI